MFSSRKTIPLPSTEDPDYLKLYTISATGAPVVPSDYLERLGEIKNAKPIPWAQTPGFAIFHEGASLRYLVVCWWGNDNELFNSVSVFENGSWIEDTSKYSFCLWDLEVIWHERNSYIKHLYSGTQDLNAYREDTFAN
ncbi:hypothetical protein [Pelagicoccus mobilis]|uniref:Uncharacterized protein n=1 Tax=Pelagicoccus mobilis TaxID=415221 RepID=A0A934RZF2_9BACT|nr:hypothetical protein [Pelagicoccus mobilis]MBK1879557.1 hypothetical protein [Pelagicoccus mobilis]